MYIPLHSSVEVETCTETLIKHEIVFATLRSFMVTELNGRCPIPLGPILSFISGQNASEPRCCPAVLSLVRVQRMMTSGVGILLYRVVITTKPMFHHVCCVCTECTLLIIAGTAKSVNAHLSARQAKLLLHHGTPIDASHRKTSRAFPSPP
jgi:hypothetical protein